MAGAGKSAVGKKLAELLDFRFVDIDKIIEEKSGLKLQKIIFNHGEKKLQEMEENAVLELSDANNRVISPGGSIIYSGKAMRLLRKISFIIFLDAPLALIKSRIGNYKSRGIIGLKDKDLKEIFEERMPLYEKWADIKIKNNMDVGHIAKIIISKLKKKNHATKYASSRGDRDYCQKRKIFNNKTRAA